MIPDLPNIPPPPRPQSMIQVINKLIEHGRDRATEAQGPEGAKGKNLKEVESREAGQGGGEEEGSGTQVG